MDWYDRMEDWEQELGIEEFSDSFAEDGEEVIVRDK